MDPQLNPITDELFSAWIDGELSPEQASAVEAWLRDNPEQAARVQAWRADREALVAGLERWHAEHDAARGGAVPAAMQRFVLEYGTEGGHGAGAGAASGRPARVPGWSRFALAASAAGLLVAGGAIGAAVAWQVQQRGAALLAAGTPQGWVQRAAYAHSVYVPEPRHAVEVKAQEEHLARWLTRRIGVPVKLFDLREFGFELVGGRLLPDGPGKSAQLMYQDPAGARVTVYLRKPEKGVDAAFRYERQGDLGLFYWVEEGCGYAVVGPLPRERLLALAQSIYEQDPRLPDPLATAPGASKPAPGAAPTSPSPSPQPAATPERRATQ